MAVLDIVIGNGIANLVIPVSDSTPMSTRAQDSTVAILAAFSPSSQTFKVTWGFRIVTGFNDTLIHAFNLNGSATNVSTTIPAGDYASGAALASAITTAQTASEALFSGGPRGTILCEYDLAGTGKFSWTWSELRPTISQFIIRGTPATYATQAISTVGVTLGGAGITGTGASGTVTANNEVRVHRFAFAFGGAGGSVRMADAAFTAESFFGITATINKTIGFYLTELDMLDPEPPPEPPPVFNPGSYAAMVAAEPRAGGISIRAFVVPKGKDTVHMGPPPVEWRHRDSEHVAQALQRIKAGLDHGLQFSLSQKWKSLQPDERAELVRWPVAKVRAWLTDDPFFHW